MIKSIGIFAVVLALAGTQLAAQTAWKLDKAHSAVKFRVSHLVISEVEGMFKDFDVTFSYTKDDFSDANLSATIKVASVFTDNENRDKHLRSSEFFDAEKYPDITFKSASFEKTGKDTYKIAGDLSIRGVTKPVVLDAVYRGQVRAWGKTIVAFSAKTEINRFDYGVQWDTKTETGALVAGETVKIMLTYEGAKQ